MGTLTSQPFINTKTNIYDERNNIFQLQKFLRKISETDDAIPFLNTDGIFGNETALAVGIFQETRGLSKTGEVDYETWKLISGEYEQLSRLNNAEPVFVFPVDVYEIKNGDSFDAVTVIQLMLNSFASEYDNFEGVSLTGIYDSETADAVKNFQSVSMLAPTGNTDRHTWNEMAGLYRALLS